MVTRVATAPLIKPSSSITVSGLFASRTGSPSGGGPQRTQLPELNARNLSALCREYAALARQSALPLCEEQKAIAKKMSGVEALCARVLYLMALRSTELNTSTTTLRDLRELRQRTHVLDDAVRYAVRRGDALEARLARLQGRSISGVDDNMVDGML